MANPEEFQQRIQLLYQKVWPASQDRDSFIYSSLSEMLTKLDESGTSELFKLLVPNEISAYVSICGPARFASLVLKDVVTLEECKDISSDPPNAKVIKSLFEKLTGLIRRKSDNHSTVDPIFSVAEFLPQDLETRLLLSTGQSTSLSFTTLIEAHYDTALEWMSGYEVTDLVALLATFETRTRDRVLSGLPEIKARRIKNTILTVQPRGLELKSKLQSALKQLDKENSGEELNRVA